MNTQVDARRAALPRLILVIVPALLALALLLSSPAVHAAATARLALGPETGSIDAWPATTVLVDPGGKLDAATALAAADRYAAPRTARGVLELVKAPHWVRIPLRVSLDAPQDWVLQIDFGMLDEVEFYLSLIHISEPTRPY